ncbi:MAG: radical SAM protein [Deltaproteobacteria bacterium]|nr:radical SAM protein [Deltaproteobacteria bacterium]
MAKGSVQPRIRWEEIRAYADRFEENDIIQAMDAGAQGELVPLAGAGKGGLSTLGPLRVGEPIVRGWSVSALAITEGLRVTLAKGDAHLLFDVGAPGSPGPDGPFEASPLRLSYGSTELSFDEVVKPIGEALASLLRAALGEDPASTWSSWRRQPVSTRHLPDSEMLEIRPDGKVYLRITDACQERCKFCFFYQSDEVDNLLRHHDLRKAIEDLDVSTLQQVILTGGEPTLHPDFVEYIGVLHGKGFKQIILQTNGIRLAEDGVLESLLPYKDRLGIGFSLHSTSAESNDELTTVSHGFFDKKIAAIRKAIDMGFRSKITLVLSRHNLSELTSFIEMCADFGNADDIFLQFSLPSFEGRMSLFLDTYPRLSELSVSLPPALARARQLDVRVALCHQCQVPPCVIPEDVQHLESLWFCETPDMWSHQDRAYGPQCDDCSMRPWCSGVWSGYAEHFGTRELVAFAADEVAGPPKSPAG